MAERRMFTQKIIDSDAFLDMPLSTQALYFHLNMRADDDGFINNARKIQRMIGATDDDLKVLVVKRFVLAFDNGVIVIKHWRMHNLLRKDRYSPTQYKELMEGLDLKSNGAYTEKYDVAQLGTPSDGDVATVWQPDGNQMAPQVSIGEVSTVECRAGECSVGEAAATTTDAPDLQEVVDYAEAQGLRSVNCYRFYEYYSGCNWVTSKGKPIDWRLKIREWDHGDSQRPRQTSSNPFIDILNNSN